MNWYKKHQIKTASLNDLINRILKILKISSITTLAGVIGLTAPQTIVQIQKNPQKVVQEAQDQLGQQEMPSQNINQQIEQETQENIEKEKNQENIEEKQNKINIEDLIKKNEGVSNQVYYLDNIPHIGIGFNLLRGDAEKLLNNVGVDINNVIKNKKRLTNEQINYLFEYTFNEAKGIAYRFMPSLDDFPQPIKAVITDMSFNLNNSIFEFQNFEKAILNKNYNRAIEEMKDSIWYSQVPNRVNHLISIVQEVKN